jgi:hypothetical protein
VELASEPVERDDAAFARETPVYTYWLSRCEGFSVRAGRRALGVV